MSEQVHKRLSDEQVRMIRTEREGRSLNYDS